ncbi:MAG: MBL fold metallo-hydrolase [Candidatus Omnitrophota bacterium]|jgi:glyoxylase-like metal-dependent hydrolase (beta-lactamase superfamily II)
MNNLDLKTFALGELYTNCYVVYDKETRDTFIIDAPWPFDTVSQFIAKEKLNVIFLLLTHGHFDHIGGIRDLSYPFAAHKDEDQLLKSSVMNGSIYFNSSVKVDRDVDFFLKEGEPVNFGRLVIDVLHTPGHTPGSVCIKIGKWLFSGDTIFLSAIGRTDIALGSHETLMKSIKDKILVLPKDTIIYPGHGAPTTVEKEIKDNPFFKD